MNIRLGVFCPFCTSGNLTVTDHDEEPESMEWQFVCRGCGYMWEEP